MVQALRKVVSELKPWPMTMVLISLDASTYFAEYLGMTQILCRQQQEIARQHIGYASGKLTVEHLSSVVTYFLADIEQNLGIGALAAIEEWQARAYPGHLLETQFWMWSVLLSILQQSWDSDEEECDSRPKKRLITHQFRIIDYVNYISSSRVEIDAVTEAGLSDWDLHIQLSCSEWCDVPTRLSQVVQTIAAGKFWSQLLRNVSLADIADLQEWAYEIALREDMPLDYIMVPARQIVDELYG